jgi:hypothetical protein
MQAARMIAWRLRLSDRGGMLDSISPRAAERDQEMAMNRPNHGRNPT